MPFPLIFEKQCWDSTRCAHRNSKVLFIEASRISECPRSMQTMQTMSAPTCPRSWVSQCQCLARPFHVCLLSQGLSPAMHHLLLLRLQILLLLRVHPHPGRGHQQRRWSWMEWTECPFFVPNLRMVCSWIFIAAFLRVLVFLDHCVFPPVCLHLSFRLFLLIAMNIVSAILVLIAIFKMTALLLTMGFSAHWIHLVQRRALQKSKKPGIRTQM